MTISAMRDVWSIWSREPVVVVGVLRILLVALVGLALGLSAVQVTLVVILFEFVFTVLTRLAVYAPSTVAQKRVAGAAKVLEAAGGIVVTDASLVTAESLNPAVTDILETTVAEPLPKDVEQ